MCHPCLPRPAQQGGPHRLTLESPGLVWWLSEEEALEGSRSTSVPALSPVGGSYAWGPPRGLQDGMG